MQIVGTRISKKGEEGARNREVSARLSNFFGYANALLLSK